MTFLFRVKDISNYKDKMDEVQKILFVTGSTQRFIKSLRVWIEHVTMAKNTGICDVEAHIWLADDVDETTEEFIKDSWIFTHRFPTMAISGFTDIWDPQHFAWKLYILHEVNQMRYDGSTHLVIYMDTGVAFTQWLPETALQLTLRQGVCIFNDDEQFNRQWCHDVFCRSLTVTEKEKDEHQIWAGAVTFLQGHPRAAALFKEAWALAQKRDIIVGEKWSGLDSSGKHYGHRHDQSILSLLSSRAKLERYPLRKVYSDGPSNANIDTVCFFVHRGNV